MRHAMILALALDTGLFASSGRSADHPPALPKDGWISLFNGKDLAG